MMGLLVAPSCRLLLTALKWVVLRVFAHTTKMTKNEECIFWIVFFFAYLESVSLYP